MKINKTSINPDKYVDCQDFAFQDKEELAGNYCLRLKDFINNRSF